MKLLEELAKSEHDQWRRWANAVYAEVSGPRQKRWDVLMAKDYDELSEEEKEQDRVWARKTLKIIRKHLEEKP